MYTSPDDEHNFNIGNKEIVMVDEYTYLGVRLMEKIQERQKKDEKIKVNRW